MEDTEHSKVGLKSIALRTKSFAKVNNRKTPFPYLFAKVRVAPSWRFTPLWQIHGSKCCNYQRGLMLRKCILCLITAAVSMQLQAWLARLIRTTAGAYGDRMEAAIWALCQSCCKAHVWWHCGDNYALRFFLTSWAPASVDDPCSKKQRRSSSARITPRMLLQLTRVLVPRLNAGSREFRSVHLFSSRWLSRKKKPAGWWANLNPSRFNGCFL